MSRSSFERDDPRKCIYLVDNGNNLEGFKSIGDSCPAPESQCVINTESDFQEFVSVCYPESVKARWMDLDQVTFAKMADPISWELARSEYLDNQLDDGLIVTFDNGSTYFNVHDIEIFLDESEKGYRG